MQVPFKQMFVRVVPHVERFGTNPRMLFKRIAPALPLHIRALVSSGPRQFPPLPESGGLESLHARVLAQQFPHDCHKARLLLFKYVNPELSGHGSMFGHGPSTSFPWLPCVRPLSAAYLCVFAN